jgi:MFS family permease
MHELRRWNIFIATFTFAAFLYVPFIAPYLKANITQTYGLPIGIWFGIFAAAVPLSIILTTHAIGSFADARGRRIVILSGLLLTAASMLLYLLSTDPILLLMARMAETIGYSTVVLITLAQVNDKLSDQGRGKAQGIFLSIQQIGNMLGPLVGAWLSTMMPKAPFLAALAIFIALIIMLPSAVPIQPGKLRLNLIDNWKSFLGFRKLKGVAVLGMAMSAQMPAFYFFLPLLILERFGRIEYVGMAMLALAALKPLQFVAGMLVDTYGKARLSIVGCLIVGAGLFLISVATSLPALLAIMVLISAGEAFWNVGAWTMLSSVGEANHIEGQVVGTYASIAKVGEFFAALLFGIIAATLGLTTIFSMAGYIIIVGVLVSLFYLRDLPGPR